MAAFYNADDSDHSGSTIACAYGQPAHYAGRRPKTFTSLLGPLTLHRAYYRCTACRRGSCPRDRALVCRTPRCRPPRRGWWDWRQRASASPKRASGWGNWPAWRSTPSRSSARPKALGREVAADERESVEPEAGAAPTMYLGLDGTGVPVRKSEVEGRRGKQPDGVAKTREVKLATVWTAETRTADGLPERDLGRSATAPRSRARPAAPPTRAPPPSRNGHTAKRGAAASTPRRAASSSATGPSGSGIWPPNNSPALSKSSTSTTPRGICPMSPRPSTAPARTSPPAGARPGGTSWTRAGSMPSLPNSAPTGTPARRPASASTT